MFPHIDRSIANDTIVAMLFASLSIASLGFAASGPGVELAGKTIEEYSQALDDSDRTVRLRAARSLTVMGQAAGATLIEALKSDDPAVRYIAAAGLGRIGGKSLEQSSDSLEALVVDSRSHAVQMAAAFALCRFGKTSEYHSVLVDAMSSPDRGTVCAAAELLAEIGPAAKEAIASLKKIHAKNEPGVKGGDYHIGGAAMNALRKIDPENSE